MAAMMAVVFTMFSQVLYLEAITLTIAVLALTFERREVFYGCLLYTSRCV